MKPAGSGDMAASVDRSPKEKWLDALDDWYLDIAGNSYYKEWVYCYFESNDGESQMNFTVTLWPTPAEPPKASTPEAGASSGKGNTMKAGSTPSLANLRSIKELLPGREEAQNEKIVVRKRPGTGDGGNGLTASDQNTTESRDYLLHNPETEDSLKGAHSSALNRDLLKLLVLAHPPKDSTAFISLAAITTPDVFKQDPRMHTDAARYGILLRAALVAKVTGSKANLALYINRLEELRSLINEATELPMPFLRKAELVRYLWRLLEKTREMAPVIPDELRSLPPRLRTSLQGSNVPDPVRSPSPDLRAAPQGARSTRKGTDDTPPAAPAKRSPWVVMRDRIDGLCNAIWYGWNLTLPRRIDDNFSVFTQCGHGCAIAAFLLLLSLSLHPSLVLLALLSAACAGLLYALAAHRLTMPDRIALLINDKIETVLDSTLAELMKANMDVQIGRLGRKEPPGLMSESVARKLDDAFALKELVNSYESTVRARSRHVATEVRKANDIRLESHQRLRNAALGVTASFVLLEIGNRIQENRDLQLGTDPMSYAYWLLRGGPAPVANGVTEGATETHPVILDCALTEIIQQEAPSPECLAQWRQSALESSSQLLFLVFLIAMLMFIVRITRRAVKQDES